jgi:pimeloyl-ACP methyl ester carboxylesterase
MFDHSRSFATLAPLLAERFRVIAFDARGHGDSDWADAYAWPADIRDIGNILQWLDEPAHLVGHSKGGGQATDAAVYYPERVRQVVNIDGFGPPDEPLGLPHTPPRDLSLPDRFAMFLDKQRRNASQPPMWRPTHDFEELVKRRRTQNPRLDPEWLRYFLYFAARRSQDGWRWKADPQLADGFGPWQADWIAPLWQHLRAPLLAVVGTEADTWGPLPDDLLERRLEYVPDLSRAKVEGTGHFVHMERPRQTADILLDFLDL